MLTAEEDISLQYLQSRSGGWGSSSTFVEATLTGPMWDICLPPENTLDRAEADYLREKDAFERLLPSLLKTHPGMFVAIHDGRPAMFNAAEVELARAFLEQYGDTHVYIGFVGQEPPAYQLRPQR